MHDTRESVTALLVDDNRDVVDSLACALEIKGLRIERAYDGETGLQRALALVPDAIILDLLLPDLDGYTLAQAVRADPRCRDTFLIAYTGDATDAARLRCASAGIDFYVLKPAEPDQLYDLVVRTARVPGLPATERRRVSP